jgi:hypothetical protein
MMAVCPTISLIPRQSARANSAILRTIDCGTRKRREGAPAGTFIRAMEKHQRVQVGAIVAAARWIRGKQGTVAGVWQCANLWARVRRCLVALSGALGF